MKKWLFVILLICPLINGSPCPAQDYVTDNYVKAKQMAKQTNKPIFVFFHASWCEPCKEFEEKTLRAKCIQKYLLDNYIVVDLDVDKNKALYTRFQQAFANTPGVNFVLRGVPSYFIIRPNGIAFLRWGQGHRTTSEFEDWIKGEMP